MRKLTAFIAGLIFGLGLLLAGMANPAKVLGFLDLAGAWDPSLGLVMAGAIGVADWRAGQAIPGGRDVAAEVVDAYYARHLPARRSSPARAMRTSGSCWRRSGGCMRSRS